MRSAPATFAPLHHQRVEEAQVHAHMDWGLGGIRGKEGERLEARRNFVGVYILSTGEYTIAEIPKEWLKDLEALGPVVFGATFSDTARGRHCVLYSDCEPFVRADNRYGRSSSPPLDMALKVSALLQITLNARFTIYDSLSKQEEERFRKECGPMLQPKASPTKPRLPTPQSFWKRRWDSWWPR